MPVDDILLELEDSYEKSNEHLAGELRGIRSGRATPALVENLRVDYFGAPTELRQIASISVPEATQIVIKPYSPGDLKTIEKGINESKLGMSPQSDGKQIRLNVPAMSQERRKQMIGQCKELAERTKVQMRNQRRDANKALEAEQKAGDIGEDDAAKGKEQVQELLKQYEAKADEMIDRKTAEIMEV
ncbi:MAG: ribosome recycling factor [Phycisphaerae bacterium]